MTDLHFTHGGKSHSVRVLSVDDKPSGAVVYEGLVDGREYVYWESDPDASGEVTVWNLFRDAIDAWLEHQQDDSQTKTRWRE